MQDEPGDQDNRGRRAFARLQVLNAAVWAATILGVAVSAKASNEFIYVLLVLIVGFSLSCGVINTFERPDQPT